MGAAGRLNKGHVPGHREEEMEPEIIGNYNHLTLNVKDIGGKAEGRVRDDSEVSGLGNSED